MNASAEWAREAFHVPKAQKIRAFLWNKNRIGDDITAPANGKNGQRAHQGRQRLRHPVASDEGREDRTGCLRIWKKCGARRSGTACSPACAAETWITTDACRSRNSAERGGTAYQLVGGLIGQRQCGHQQGLRERRGSLLGGDGFGRFHLRSRTAMAMAYAENIYCCKAEEESVRPLRTMIFIMMREGHGKNCNFAPMPTRAARLFCRACRNITSMLRVRR